MDLILPKPHPYNVPHPQNDTSQLRMRSHGETPRYACDYAVVYNHKHTREQFLHVIWGMSLSVFDVGGFFLVCICKTVDSSSQGQCFAYFLLVFLCVRSSVPVQLIAWKDLSLK